MTVPPSNDVIEAIASRLLGGGQEAMADHFRHLVVMLMRKERMSMNAAMTRLRQMTEFGIERSLAADVEGRIDPRRIEWLHEGLDLAERELRRMLETAREIVKLDDEGPDEVEPLTQEQLESIGAEADRLTGRYGPL